MTTARNDAPMSTGLRGWPAIASGVALLLGAGAALQVLVDVIVNMSQDKAQAPTTAIKFMGLAGDVATVVPILLIAAVLVVLSAALIGVDDRRGLAAMIVAVTAVVVALLFLLALLMSFSEVGGRSVAGAEPWQTRIHLLLGGIAALAAAALANEARDRT